MRISRVTVLGICWAWLFVLAGCSANKDVEPAKPVAAHVHVHGPHDGELIEIGDEKYHAEMVHDNQTVTIYVLDDKHERPVPITADSITIHMVANDKPIDFKLSAKPQEGDPAGKTSRFESHDQALDLALDDEQAQRELVIPINGETYHAKFVHFDDEHHHHHEAPGGAESK